MADSPQLPENTEPAARVEAAADSALITIKQAESLFRIEASTIRRRLRKGAIAGARRVSSDKGEVWCFPADSLDALGYARANGTTEGRVVSDSASASVLENVLEDTLEELREQLASMRKRLDLEQRQLEETTGQKAAAEVEIGRLQEREKALEARREAEQEQAAQRYREALELGWRQRRKRRKALEKPAESLD